MLEDLGMEVQNLAAGGPPLLLGSLGRNPALPTLLFYGHYDVQPPEPLEAWSSPPFEPEVRDGRIFARGAGDNKGQFFCHLVAMEAFRSAAGGLPSVNVRVLLDGEEECGSPHLLESVRHSSDILAGVDVVVTADGPYHESGSPCVICGVRGLLYVELRCRGASRDLHSGHYGGIAPLPAWRLVQCLGSLLDGEGRVAYPGFLDSVREPGADERAALEAIPATEEEIARGLGLTSLPSGPGGGFLERVQFRPHANISGIRCGYAGEGPKTVIPCEAVAKLDIRLVPDQDPDAVFEALREHLRRSGFGDVEAVALQAVPASRTPVGHPVVRTITRAVERGWGGKPILVPSLGATLPEHVFTGELGIPSVLVPYANPDERNHAPDENLLLEAFRRGIRTSAAILAEMASYRRS
jgi:acetylornithine deacetylase/succinyl-diaminopimelate desuccinylase-like protein